MDTKQLAGDLITVASEYANALSASFTNMACNDGFGKDKLQFCALHNMTAAIIASSGVMAASHVLGVDAAKDMREIIIAQLRDLKL